MTSEDNNYVDLTNILDENNKKCKIPQFVKDLLYILIPLAIGIGIITLISFLV